uniref:Uncharacterized protein n=1 Tax=Candidatus Methanogaster sp. ANME-2c ERB4 TaxID=2759911 RepID=A0A7G9Y1A6_9EURY|nr:hypothetical protein EABBNKNM_00005 [Methanosarcinales archaeon ANME-2c ERB4]QNO42714.1 hypothetical protein APGODIHH_00003 [Methanosarcinales archaeon ANME-2c ERB4]
MCMMYHDESGVSVIIGTLMLILITIIAASGLALMVSGMQKDAMERESHLAAVESENLRIISIDPVGNSTHWHSVNVTIMNLNTADSRVTAISLNGVHAMNYRAKDGSGSGDLDYYKEYPVGYNFKKRVVVPAAGSKEICLNFTEIVINTSENGNITFTGWTNNSVNYTYPLPKHPRVAYPYVLYPDMVYSATVKNVTGSNVIVTPSGNYEMDTTGNITLFYTGSMTNTSNYTINYTTHFDTFPPPFPVSKNEPLTIEVITSLINIFERTFMPPVPLAEVQFEIERVVDSNGSVSYRDYLILDASDSFDPDGFITEYRWAVWDNSTSIYDYNNLTGMKVRPVKLNLATCQNVEIDLEVRDDTGMVSRLSQRSGNITIP